MTQQLNPCPFCVRIVEYLTVNVRDTGNSFLSIVCCASMAVIYDHEKGEQKKAKAELIERWNKRHGAGE